MQDRYKEKRLKTFLIHRLRRISYMWPSRKKAMQAARIERGRYKCATCENIFGPKEISLDHVTPIVPVTGWDNWDGFLYRLFCEEEGFQVLCKTCHDDKTKEENLERKKHGKS